MGNGGCLISSGVAMGINNDFSNAYAVPTIVAGATEIIHNLLPMQTNDYTELQETSFIDDTVGLINNYADNVSDTSNVIFESPYRPTTTPIINNHL
jgi:hypothetical protein